MCGKRQLPVTSEGVVTVSATYRKSWWFRLPIQCGFDFEDINHFFFNCPLFGAERTELLTNLLTLGITDVNLSLLLIGCDDYDEELNKNVFKFVHHFIDSTGRL